MNIVWSPEALADIEAALDYLMPRNRPAAEKLMVGIVTAIERLAEGAIDGPEHVLRSGERVRGWPYPPFRVYYQRAPEGMFVVRVYHQRRRPIAR